jgi:hypothetical protein
MPIFGKKQGDICTKDHDCESGFVCLKDARGEKSCQTPVVGAQELGEVTHSYSFTEVLSECSPNVYWLV